MTGRIFRSILLAAIVVLLAALLIVTGFLYNYFGDVQEQQLRDELGLAAAATEQLGEDYLRPLDSGRYRLTWVAADGRVICDTQVDESTMVNHADREEIREAMAGGRGSSYRYSDTLTERTIYEAVRLSDGSVLRISVSRATAAVLVLGMLQPILIVAVIAIVLSAVLAHSMARRAVEPLNRLDLEHPLENDVYEELSPLLHRIHAQHLQIAGQMRKLKRKTDEFEQITGNLKEGLVLLDAEGVILSMNPAARQLFQAEGDCAGRDFVTVDRNRELSLALERAMACGHSELRGARGGREYLFDLSRIESEGAVIGAVILVFDVTEQIAGERSRREFTANVSHELKTPLQSIIGSAELLEHNLVREEDVPRFVGHIRKEASRLVSLIEDIIRLSQMDEGGQLPEETVCLQELAREILTSLEPAAAARGITLSLTGGEGVLPGVRRLLYEIIYNLCDNGIKYNLEGGTLQVEIEDGADNVTLRVRDSGIGIPEAHRSRIFERFYRVDKSHSKQSGGTGLGLSIVKHAVQHHQGKITLDSRPGEGTVMEVTFPRRREPEQTE